MPMGGGKIIIIIKKVCTLIWARETERHDEGVMQERLKRERKKKKKRKEMFREWGETAKCRGKKFGMWSFEVFEVYFHDAVLLEGDHCLTVVNSLHASNSPPPVLYPTSSLFYSRYISCQSWFHTHPLL